MVDRQPAAQESIATNGVEAVAQWSEAKEQLADARLYWLATVQPDTRPHVMPLFAVWLDDALYFTSNNHARKARNLARDPHCVITTSGSRMELVVEGVATRVMDDAVLQRAARIYLSKYGWSLTIRDHAYWAEYGAPSAGAPPYELYKIQPTMVFGLGNTEPFGATRWCFRLSA